MFSLLIAVGLARAPVAATTYTVTSLLDGVAVDGECRLREAIRAAKLDVAVNDCPAGDVTDIIVLAATGTYAFAEGEETVALEALTIRGVTASPENHVIDMADQNRFLVWTGDTTLVLENFTLRDGNAFGAGSEEGGALRLAAGTVTLRNLVIEGCRAASGGGVHLEVGDGAVGNVTFDRVRFIDNVAQGASLPSGGGMQVYIVESGHLSVRDSLFSGNRAESASPGAFAIGGGIYLAAFPGPITVEISGTTFQSNLAVAPTGGTGGGISLVTSAGTATQITDSTFAGNAVTDSASTDLAQALEASGSGTAAIELRRLRVTGNDASASAEAQVVLRASNTADVLLESSLVANGSGPGLLAAAGDGARLVVSQSTIASNGLTGVLARGFSTVPLRIEGSVLWGNGAVNDDLEIFGTVDADRVANHNWIGDQGDADPLFVDPALGDFGLQALSGAVDAGDATFAALGPFDLAHAPRVVGAEVDLGAFEHDGLFADDFESASTGAWATAIP